MIPITKPFLDKREIDAVKNVLLSGWVTQGPKVKEFEDVFAAYVGSGYACAVSSCTAALHMALLTVGVKPGDMVITVSHTFIATANSIRHCGAEPIFIDIDLETYNILPNALEKCLHESLNREPRVAAIILVHQMGMPCDLNRLLPIAKRFNIPVIEDAACAVGSEILTNEGKGWDRIGKPHGDIACFSFHPRKLITTGEGGMLTTDNPEMDRRFRLLRQHGMSISDRQRHSLKKVVFEEYLTTGYNYKMSDLQAVIGIEQLKKLSSMLKERRKIATIYRERLKNISWLILPLEPPYCRTNWQSYPVRVSEDAPIKRDRLMQSLLDAGISTRRGIMNAHQEKAYGLSGVALKNSESARDSIMLLPLFCGINGKEIEKVVKEIKDA